MLDEKQQMQEVQYEFPYHHLTNFQSFDNHKVFYGGLSYYGYINKVIEYVFEEKFSTLLDVGCGDGKMLYEIARKKSDAHMVGVDYSERAILLAKAFNYGNGVQFIAGDVADIKEEFDVVTIIETLEHIPDNNMRHIIDALYKCVKINGRLIVSVPSTNDPLNPKHYRHYTLEMLKKDFSNWELISYSYPISNSKIYEFIVKLSGKLSNFGFLRKIFLKVAQSYFHTGITTTGTHIQCVFKKSI